MLIESDIALMIQKAVYFQDVTFPDNPFSDDSLFELLHESSLLIDGRVVSHVQAFIVRKTLSSCTLYMNTIPM